jgi:hypothetical protein
MQRFVKLLVPLCDQGFLSGGPGLRSVDTQKVRAVNMRQEL